MSDDPLILQHRKVYRWEPEFDITPLELAMILPAFFVRPEDAERHIESLAPRIRRHFKEGPCDCGSRHEKPDQ